MNRGHGSVVCGISVFCIGRSILEVGDRLAGDLPASHLPENTDSGEATAQNADEHAAGTGIQIREHDVKATPQSQSSPETP